MPFRGSDGHPFMCGWPYQWMFFVILIDQQRRMYLISRFPSVVGIWVTLPFQEVLQSLITSVMTVIDNGLHLVLRFATHDIWWRPHVVGPFLFRLLIWSEE
jgi:hypothetical protein